MYVGRLSKEKGIFDLISMLNDGNSRINLSIVGDSKNLKFENPNIKLLGYISDEKLLMKAYDNCNITILPSFTEEGYPYVIDESLARKRPVIIFEEISYVVNNKKGIFITRRDTVSLNKTTDYILENYNKIQQEISGNELPTKKVCLNKFQTLLEFN